MADDPSQFKVEHKTLLEHWIKAKQVLGARRKRGEPQFPTGIDEIDEITGGMQPGEIWIVAGEPGAGKTTLSTQMARRFADNTENSILFLSLEMTGWDLSLRIYSEMFGADYLGLIMGRVEIPPEHDSVIEAYFSAIDFEIVEHGFKFSEVLAVFDELYKSKKPDIIVLDFIQLIDWMETTGQERTAIDNYIRKIKQLSKDYGVGFVVISQLSRRGRGEKSERPSKSNLKGSGGLEAAADKVLIVFSEEVDSGFGSTERRDYILVDKNRQGPTKLIEVWFDRAHYRYRNLSEKAALPGVKEICDQFKGTIVGGFDAGTRSDKPLKLVKNREPIKPVDAPKTLPHIQQNIGFVQRDVDTGEDIVKLD